jgi:hypothetical protein
MSFDALYIETYKRMAEIVLEYTQLDRTLVIDNLLLSYPSYK